jgi:solute carrier family 25 oxoglutarate transporter 11
LDAAILRQFIYCGGRLGIYKKAEDYTKDTHNRNMTFGEKVAWSLFSGAAGSLIATPTDVALIRFQSDNSLPKEKRRNYKNVFDALGRMYREEGLLGMWTGATPTVARAMALNCAQLVSYNQTKEILMQRLGTKDETVSVRLLASAFSGIATAFCSLPFDNIKTKMMRMKKSKSFT